MKTFENKRTLEIRKQINQGLKKDDFFDLTQEYHDLKIQLYNELKKINI